MIENGRVLAPNNDYAVFWIDLLQFADAVSIKTHDDPDRTKYTLDQLIPSNRHLRTTESDGCWRSTMARRRSRLSDPRHCPVLPRKDPLYLELTNLR